MDFDVRKSDADALASWVNAFVGHMIEGLEGVAAAGSSLGVLDGFAGVAADSSCAYWNEVHAPILKGGQTMKLWTSEQSARYMVIIRANQCRHLKSPTMISEAR